MQQINPRIIEVLSQHNIDKDQGILCLLAFFYNLNPEESLPEVIVKSVSVSKIVEKNYETKELVWNISLFDGQEMNFEWVIDWILPWRRMNPERAGSARDAIPRMKKFFAKYPEFRKDDVYRARDLYLAGINNTQYLMKSHKFIFDGSGTMQKSTLLEYCERVKTTGTITSQRGQVIK